MQSRIAGFIIYDSAVISNNFVFHHPYGNGIIKSTHKLPHVPPTYKIGKITQDNSQPTIKINQHKKCQNS